METWITICVAALGLFIVLEETIHYFWNRYLFESRTNDTRRIGKLKMLLIQFINKYKKSHSL